MSEHVLSDILRNELKDHEYACGYVTECLTTIDDLMGEKKALAARVAELEKALKDVRDTLVCTKPHPFEYDCDHRCRECGSSTAYAKDLIDACFPDADSAR